MYELECGACHQMTEVVSETPVAEWSCEHCESESITSLPTDVEGNLI